MRRLRAVELAFLVLTVACGQESDPTRRPVGDDEVGGHVVATVDGVGITVAEVRAEAERHGVTPRVALDRLVDHALLAAEAERRGYGDAPEARRVARQALVQSFLAAAVEGEVTEATIRPEAVRAAWEADPDFHKPERRNVMHLLVEVAADAPAADDARARATVDRVVAELLASDDPALVLTGYQAAGSIEGVHVRVEAIPVVTRESALVEPFLDAVFSVRRPGPVARSVRSSFGWHAILVTSVIPAFDVSLEEAEPYLRRHLLVEARNQRLEALLAELAEETPIERVEPAIQAALAREAGS